jgi:hypothetical protein
MTHSIRYTSDASIYDLEELTVTHILNSYKLLKNHSDDLSESISPELGQQQNDSSRLSSTGQNDTSLVV